MPCVRYLSFNWGVGVDCVVHVGFMCVSCWCRAWLQLGFICVSVGFHLGFRLDIIWVPFGGAAEFHLSSMWVTCGFHVSCM